MDVSSLERASKDGTSVFLHTSKPLLAMLHITHFTKS